MQNQNKWSFWENSRLRCFVANFIADGFTSFLCYFFWAKSAFVLIFTLLECLSTPSPSSTLSQSSTPSPSSSSGMTARNLRLSEQPWRCWRLGWVKFRFMSQFFSSSSISACVIEKISLDPLWDPFEYSWPSHTLAFGRWTDLQGKKTVQYC